MRSIGLVVLFLGLGMIVGMASEPLQAVDTVDITQYVGRWYAIASIPTSFERQCVQGTTAEYTLLENGQVEVLNTCYDADGNRDVAIGRAWIPDVESSSKLRVSFVQFLGIWWFSAPYWVIDLAPDYSYAVVGHPSRKYGWILSRTPMLSSPVMDSIVKRIEALGYDFDDFRKTDQSMHIQPSRPYWEDRDCGCP